MKLNYFGHRKKTFYLCFEKNRDDMSKMVLDLHEIYNKGSLIDKALRDVIDEAVARKTDRIEIIPGKGSGQLKKKVLRFLAQKEIKSLYHRIEKDRDNFGKIIVYFRF